MEDIRQQAKLAYDRTLARKNLSESMHARMLLAHQGGLFLCDSQLISLLQCYADETEIVILDSQGIPHKVKPEILLPLVKQRHQECMNAWLIAYHDLARIRTAKDV